MSTPTPTIIHLSDIHRTTDEPVSNADILHWLKADLERHAEEDIPTPNVIVVSGDLTQSAEPAEYNEAQELVLGLADHLELKRDRIAIVPGNHDVHWPTAERAFTASKTGAKLGPLDVKLGSGPVGALIAKGEQEYQERLANFRAFYLQLTGKPYSLDRRQAYTIHEFDDLGLAIAGLSSVDLNDCWRFEGRIHMEAIQAAAEALDRFSGWRVAVWHHDLNWRQAPGSDCLVTDSLTALSARVFDVGLCGHTHRAGLHDAIQLDGFPLAVVAAGSLCAGARQRGESVPRGYNIVTFSGNRIGIYERTKEAVGKPWQARPFRLNGKYVGAREVPIHSKTRRDAAKSEVVAGDPEAAIESKRGIESQRGNSAQSIPELSIGLRLRAHVQEALTRQDHQAVAMGLSTLADWINDPPSNNFDAIYDRWRALRGPFDALDPSPWLNGASGTELVAAAVASVVYFYQFDSGVRALKFAGIAKELALVTDEAVANAHACRVLGSALLSVGRLEECLRELHEAEKWLELASPGSSWVVLVMKGMAHLRLGEGTQAKSDIAGAIDVLERVGGRGSLRELGYAYLARSRVAIELDDAITASVDSKSALEIFSACNDTVGRARVHGVRALALEKRKRHAQALDEYSRAESLLESIRARVLLGSMKAERAHLLATQSRSVEAEALFDEALGILGAERDATQLAAALTRRAESAAQRPGGAERAVRLYREAAGVYSSAGSGFAEAEARCELLAAEEARKMGDRTLVGELAHAGMRHAKAARSERLEEAARQILDWFDGSGKS